MSCQLCSNEFFCTSIFCELMMMMMTWKFWELQCACDCDLKVAIADAAARPNLSPLSPVEYVGPRVYKWSSDDRVEPTAKGTRRGSGTADDGWRVGFMSGQRRRGRMTTKGGRALTDQPGDGHFHPWTFSPSDISLPVFSPCGSKGVE